MAIGIAANTVIAPPHRGDSSVVSSGVAVSIADRTMRSVRLRFESSWKSTIVATIAIAAQDRKSWNDAS